MANNFQITISAVDKATAVVKKVNNQVSQFVRPIMEIKQASVSLGKELGIGRMGKEFGNVSRAAGDVGQKVSGIIAPLAAVVGVGSIAAVVEMAKKWGDLGNEISQTSQTIGISAGELQALRGAAQLSYVSAESLTGGLKSLGDTMQDALYGRNQGALMMMNRLGIKMKRNADGAVDTSAAFSDLAESISHIKNPQVQGLVARTFGLEAALPMLRKGKAGIAELTEQMKKSGAIMGGPAIAAANAYNQSMAFLDISMSSLRNTIGAALIPVMQPMVERISAWTLANKDLIATKFAEVAKGIGEAIAGIDWNGVVEGIKSFAGGVKDVVDWLGGWKNAMIALVVIMNGSLIASVLNLGLALGKFAFSIIPPVVAGVGLLSTGLAGLMLKMALLTETAFPMLSAAFLSFGAVLEATPIGWIITAIAGIGFAGYELVKHWDDIKHWWHRLWGDMSDDASNGSDKISNATGRAAPYQPGGTSGSWDDTPIAAAASSGKSGLLGLVRQLENSGDSAVSKAGAMGRYQITGDTADTYGLDKSKLFDPAYNEMGANKILNSLQDKYGNDTDAILAAYNGGPGRANQFLAAGRNPAVLPKETQNYLSHAHQLLAQSGPAVATPYSAAPTQLDQMAAQMGITSASNNTAQQPGSNGAVTVEISFVNAPHGMKTRTQTSGAVIVNTKISHAMPGLA
jgi:hypothetical protein